MADETQKEAEAANEAGAETEATARSLLGRLRDSGEQALNELSQKLLENPTFLTALRRSVEAKESLGRTISGTMDFVNLPSKNDMAAIKEAVEHLGIRLARQERALAAIDKKLDEIKSLLAAQSSKVADADES